MSTNSAIRSAWQSAVFNNFSFPSYSYIIDPDSGFDLNLGMYLGQVNFFQWIVTSSEVPEMSLYNRVDYRIAINRTIQDDTTGTNVTSLVDDFRTLIDYVNDNLGTDWSGTISYGGTFPTLDQLNPQPVFWGTIPCWNAEIVFEGLKFVNV